MTPIHSILVSIVHPDSLVRACLTSALERTSDIKVNVSVADVFRLDSMAQRHALTHVIVADYDSGVVLAFRSVLHALPPVVIVSGADREWELRNALAHRVRGYLTSDFEQAHLDESVRALKLGSRYLCSRTANRLAESLSSDPLTVREEEVLALIVQGEPNKGISRQLDISIGTVKSHIKSTYGKLGVTSRSLAIATAARRGLLRRAPGSTAPLDVRTISPYGGRPSLQAIAV